MQNQRLLSGFLKSFGVFFFFFHFGILADSYALRVSPAFRNIPPKKLVVVIRDQTFGILSDEEFKSRFLKTFQKTIQASQIGVVLKEEMDPKEVSVEILFTINKYRTEKKWNNPKLVVPKVEAEFILYQPGSFDPALSLKNYFFCRTKSILDQGYEVQDVYQLAEEIGSFFSNTIAQSFQKPERLTGTWKDILRLEPEDIFTFVQKEKEVLGQNTGWLAYKNKGRKIQKTFSYKINLEPKGEGGIPYYDGEMVLNETYLEEPIETESYAPKQVRVYIFGNMAFIKYMEGSESMSYIFAKYIQKQTNP